VCAQPLSQIAGRRTLGAVAVAVAVAVAARSVVWWCGRSSGAGEVSQILAARFEAAAGQQRAVQAANGVRASERAERARRTDADAGADADADAGSKTGGRRVAGDGQRAAGQHW
jgi:hypothetical protein